MIVEFLSEAKSELFDAVAYYEGELSGLGQRLWDEVIRPRSWSGVNSHLARPRCESHQLGAYFFHRLILAPKYQTHI